ncbi:MAG: polysaccharide deacetylase family protein [Paludibacteraceae bacterium]|nr:polysaccharide deacetylase family protein [Paludibacteraceae bacterium]
MQFPRFLRPFFGNVTWKIPTPSKVIYLTFDDGPVPGVTPKVLDILDKYNWKATFFCVGENVTKYPELYADILKRGHNTANHTFNHMKGFQHSKEEYVENVEKAANCIDSKLFRPPHGRIKPSQLRILKKKYKIIMWDVITHDYDKKLSPEQVLGNVKRYLRKGSIVVFHDSLKAEKNVLEALPRAIEFWQNNGFSWALLDE